MFLTTSAPFIQQHELDMTCNHNCRKICYNPCRAQQIEIPENDQARNFRVAEESVKRGVMAICLTGGEPLIDSEHFFAVLDIYKTAGCYVSINSNAGLVTPGIADRLATTGLNSALISMHGLDARFEEFTEGNFRNAWNGMMLLHNAGIPVTPNFVATHYQVGDLVGVGERLAKAGIKSMTATPMLPSHGVAKHKQTILTPEDYKTYFESIREIRTFGIKIDSTLPIPPCVLTRLFPDTWQDYLDVHSPRVCMAGRSFGVISPDAIFRACIQAPYLPAYGGSIEENYEQSWQNANQWANLDLIPEDCKNCVALNICGGGCRTGCMWDNNGSVSGTTMYMGKPLTTSEAQPFIDRITHGLPVNKDQVACDHWCEDVPNFPFPIKNYPAFVFKFKPSVKFRNESGYFVIFNTANQSFSVFKRAAPTLSNFATNDPKVASLLLGMDAVDRLPPNSDWEEFKPASLPANEFLPRLGQGLDSPDKVFCLRADTGERFFF